MERRSSGRWVGVSSALAVGLMVGGCNHQPGNLGKDDRTCAEGVALNDILASAKTSADRRLVVDAVEAILKGDGEGASEKLNLALNTDPTNSALHTLNGIAYQLMARKGDVQILDLAEAGFNQALKFDPNNTVASLQLGRVYAQRKEFAKAQEEFANVLVLDPTNVTALYELASASYYGRDVKTALASIDRYIAARPDDVRGRQAAALIYAAAGERDRSQKELAVLADLNLDKVRAARLKRRVGDWNTVHDRGVLELAQAEDGGSGEGAEPSMPNPTDEGSAPPATDMETGSDTSTAGQGEPDKMVVIDAVVMRVSEEGSTSKGQNILENFSITLAPGTWAHGRSSTNGSDGISSVNVFPNASTSPGGSFSGSTGVSSSRVFTSGISFGSIVYSANIINATTAKISIHDRPSVTTLVGKKSKFYSGDDLVLGLSGNYGGSISRTPTGITMEVTPLSLNGQKVTLEIKMYGSLISGDLSTDATTKFSKISVSSIDTTVTMNLDETLLLGGIVVRSDTANKSGVPILDQIPGVQYLFSKEITNSIRKSVAFMITPKSYRKERSAIRAAFQNETDARPSLTELEKRNKDWSQGYSNKVVILRTLAPLYREFRTGDLPPLYWWQDETLTDELTRTASFLWY